MTTKNYDGDKVREQQSELFELHTKFGSQGERLNTVFNRITTISNKLADESGGLSAKEGGTLSEPNNRMPGLINDLHSDVNGYKTLIDKIDQQLSRIEKYI